MTTPDAGDQVARVVVPWGLAQGQALPQASICRFLYDKIWAYAFEIDDSPLSALTVAAPMLAGRQWRAAPPGVMDGELRPFVGTVAPMMLCADAGDPRYLSWAQMRELRGLGWGIANHSYWHTGNHWEPRHFLKAEDFRRELYWSQHLHAFFGGDGVTRAPAHFVYPNGDYHYAPFARAIGVVSASQVGGKSHGDTDDLMDLDRVHLDEGVWAADPDPLRGFPQGLPPAGAIHIDFTHDLDADPASPNRVRWTRRMEHIATRHGCDGDGSLWCAPTGAITAYVAARRAARVLVTREGLVLSVTQLSAGTPLTIRLDQVPAGMEIIAPEGGALHRQGDRAWITTGMLGVAGIAPPSPACVRVWEGVDLSAIFSAPIRLAGVRLLQRGAPPPDWRLRISATRADGSRFELGVPDGGRLDASPGVWRLYPLVPDGEAVAVTALAVTPDPCLQAMEIWALS